MSYTRAAIITGGTAHLGYHAARYIAHKHPDYLVVISSRSNSNDAAKRINDSLGQNNVIYLPLDLSDLANVRDFAQKWGAEGRPQIQALAFNAGLQFPGPVQKTKDGIESTFAVNHVGHAQLFYLLWHYLAPNARIVITSSGTHDPAQKAPMPDAIYNSAEELAYPTTDTAKYEGTQRYASSKLTNVLWAYALDSKLKQYAPDKNITVNAFDPGLMPGTGLAREYPSFQRFIWNKVLPRMVGLLRLFLGHNIHTPAESGAALGRLTVGEDVEGVSGKYFEGLKRIKSSNDSYVVEKQEDLWTWTATFLAQKDEIDPITLLELR